MHETTTPVAREVQLAADGHVEILLTSANVSVRGVDGDRVSVRTRGGEDIDEEVVVEATPLKVKIRDNPAGAQFGSLRLRKHGPADLDIDVPRTARVNLRSMSGDVRGLRHRWREPLGVGVGGPAGRARRGARQPRIDVG